MGGCVGHHDGVRDISASSYHGIIPEGGLEGNDLRVRFCLASYDSMGGRNSLMTTMIIDITMTFLTLES